MLLIVEPGAPLDATVGGRAGRRWWLWLVLLLAVVVDLLATATMTVLCAMGENQSEATQDYCGSIPNLALVGIPVAIVGAAVGYRLREDWPWIGGVLVALVLAVAVFLLVP